eukprot:5993142-Pyramimonas_sp.AAC.2
MDTDFVLWMGVEPTLCYVRILSLLLLHITCLNGNPKTLVGTRHCTKDVMQYEDVVSSKFRTPVSLLCAVCSGTNHSLASLKQPPVPLSPPSQESLRAWTSRAWET